MFEYFNERGKMKRLLILCALATVTALQAETFKFKTHSTIQPVELNKGDVAEYTLLNGETRRVEYLGGDSKILEVPCTEGVIATFTMRLKVDGEEIPFRRYLATQESFYEPAVVNGLQIWPDSTLEYLLHTVPMRYPAKGPCRQHPWKDARIVLHDATLPICPEKLAPWFRDQRMKKRFIPIKDAYHGGDCWLGPFSFGIAHGGLDIRARAGSLLYTPYAVDNQWLPQYVKRGDKNTRWRGIRRWDDGAVWSIKTSHLIQPQNPEGIALTNGAVVSTAAGTAIGWYEHTHFELHIMAKRGCEVPGRNWWEEGASGSRMDYATVQNDLPKGQPYLYHVDPWMIFWQYFRQEKRASGDLFAEISPFGPAKTGETVEFKVKRPIPKGFAAIWTFNDGTMHVGEKVRHTFAKPGAYCVTLTLTDGNKTRDRDRQVITVSGTPVSSPSLGVRADEVSFFELLPGDLPAWGTEVHLDPYSFRGDPELEFFTRSTGEKVVAKLVNKKPFLSVGEIHHYASDKGGEGCDVILLTTPDPRELYRKSSRLIQFQWDWNEFWRSPCYWVSHDYDGRIRRYETDGARKEKGKFARFYPNLASGSWEVSTGTMGFEAPYVPEAAWWVTIKCVDGIKRVWYEPLKQRIIGTFRFEQGKGYVQFESEGAKGPVMFSRMLFRPVDVK